MATIKLYQTLPDRDLVIKVCDPIDDDRERYRESFLLDGKTGRVEVFPRAVTPSEIERVKIGIQPGPDGRI